MLCSVALIRLFILSLSFYFPVLSFVQFDRGKKLMYRERVAKMFYHAYDAYLLNAFPYDELRPLTCDGVDTWGSYSLTLIDALDTLAVMGNDTEFRRVTYHLSNSLQFGDDINVSVFETNIRVVGGLIAAHLLSKRAGMELEPGWPCTGPLLRLAEDVAQRLLPAFDTATGMPYGTVNLKNGVPKDETPVTCTAGVATYILEFGVLSRLTGNPAFEDAALRALRGLWQSRTRHGLVGNHIDVQTGTWKAVDAGIGAGVDSYYEYLAKGASAFQNTELMAMLLESIVAIQKHINHEDWYFWVSSLSTHLTMAIFQSLEAFWPGVLASIGDADSAYRSVTHYFNIWRHYGFTPEFFDVVKGQVISGREGYPLRPELIESIYHLYQVTKDPLLLQMGAQIFESIEKVARVPCGYATVKDVRTHALENRMESFFLAETTKYLYLLFDEENFIHHDQGNAEIHEAAHGDCVMSSGNFVFNTEAHVLDLAGVQCCSAEKKSFDGFSSRIQHNIDLPFLMGLTKDAEKLMSGSLRHHYNISDIGEELLPEIKETAPVVPDPKEIAHVARANRVRRSFNEYCACDVPMELYERVCVRSFIDWIFLTNKCPARYCHVAVVPQTKTVPFPDNNLEIPHGSPEMLSCEISEDMDFVLYGELNPRRK